MTDQERQLIEGLTSRIQSAPAPPIDRDADELIRRGIGSRPDALYILTQTVLIQEMALDQAKAQIEQLKQNAPQARTSFLGQPTQPSGYQGSNYQRDAPAPPPPQYAPPQYEQAPPPSGGRFSGFLHNAAQTAAGIVAGEVAFSAISSLFGGHGGGGGFFGGGGQGFFGGGGGISPGSETIINNYYDDDRGHGSGSGGSDSGLSPGLSPDLEDRRFADDNTQQDDNAQDDNSQDDNSNDSQDDGSSYDDGSGSGDV